MGVLPVIRRFLARSVLDELALDWVADKSFGLALHRLDLSHLYFPWRCTGP